MSEKLWEVYASCYDAISHLAPYQEMMVEIVDRANLQDGMEILDAGCRTGNLIKEIINRQVRVKIVAVDFSKAMLKRARRKITHPM